jgi:hypothetical protein
VKKITSALWYIQFSNIFVVMFLSSETNFKTNEIINGEKVLCICASKSKIFLQVISDVYV